MTVFARPKKGSAAKKQAKQDYEDSVREIAKKASKYYGTSINPNILIKVFDKGLAAWRDGHRPGASQFAWGYSRVYSFLVGGKTVWLGDEDLFKKLGKKAQEKILEEAVWNPTKKSRYLEDFKGRSFPVRYVAGLNKTQKQARIKELTDRRNEYRKIEEKANKQGRELTKKEKDTIFRPFKTDKYLPVKPSNYTKEARKRGFGL
jgi:hypothetical protein